VDTQHSDEKQPHDLENGRSEVDYSIVFKHPAIREITNADKVTWSNRNGPLRHKFDQLQNFSDSQDAKDLQNSNDSGVTIG
jgi:hypothetical protein